MATLAQIYNWFMTDKKPTQAQFWASWGSFWHKGESIPQSAITNLLTVLNNKAEISQLNGSLTLFTPIDYLELVRRQAAYELIPGMQYRIIDYVTTVRPSLTNVISHNQPFDIIVVADSTNKLNEMARAVRSAVDVYFPFETRFESWELRYSLFNNVLLYDWADVDDGKGVVYFMKDEHGNELPYDFKNIRFRRDAVKSTTNANLSSVVDRYYAAGWEPFFDIHLNDFKYLFTFHKQADNSDLSLANNASYDNGTFGNNIIKPQLVVTVADDIHYNTMQLNNIVFNCINNEAVEGIRDNVFGYNCHSMTFGARTERNTFGEDCFRNVFLEFNKSNTFGREVQENTFGSYFGKNSFKDHVFRNMFGGSLENNVFGATIRQNSFGPDMVGNTFGSFFENNELFNVYGHNTFGNNVGRVIYNGASNNVYYGTINVKDNVVGSSFALLNLISGIDAFASPPREVTVMQSATPDTYIFESRISANLKEEINVSV